MENPLRIALCEDQAADTVMLLDHIKQSGIASACDTFTCAEELLASFVPGLYDVVFMDIYLEEGMRGLEAAAHIRESDENVILAFTTTSPDHTLESYRLGALKYLEKPLTLKGVRETLELAVTKRRSTACIFVLIGGRNTKIPLNSIIYFEQQNHAVIINTITGVLRTSQTIKLCNIEPLLPCPPFLRCHHSYIVNLRYALNIDKALKTFSMKNGGTVYIRRQDLKKATDAYENYLFAAARCGEI